MTILFEFVARNQARPLWGAGADQAADRAGRVSDPALQLYRACVEAQKNLSVWICASGARQRMTSSSFMASTIGGGPAK